MLRKKKLLLALFVTTTMSAGSFAEENPLRRPAEQQSRAELFATPLLSETEQADYRARIRSASDAAERERIRAAHYELMKARAKERGRALPDRRPAAVGEAGNTFGPELTTEEERAAQRARSRNAGKRAPEATIRASGDKPPLGEKSAADLTERAVASSNPVGEATPERGPTVRKMPDAPAAKATEPGFGSFSLPGMDAVFGPDLMSEAERAAFRARLRSARSDQERQAIRTERDDQMRQRAKEKGVTLSQ